MLTSTRNQLQTKNKKQGFFDILYSLGVFLPVNRSQMVLKQVFSNIYQLKCLNLQDSPQNDPE